MQLFYHPEAETGTAFRFDKQESGHIARVLRMQAGNSITLTDGRGSFYPAVITDANPNKVTVDILQAEYHNPRELSIHIAMAPTKNIKRMEWFVEKAVEVGIEKISFFTSRHSERVKLKIDRIEKVAIAAMKQSQKAWLPEIIEMQELEELISSSEENKKWIAHCRKEMPRHKITGAKPGEKHLVLIGPEGGFHLDEIMMAEENNFNALELSPYRLRTETAALTACQWINLEFFKQQ